MRYIAHIKRLLPLSARIKIKSTVRSLRYKGNRFFCTCCKGRFRVFLPGGVSQRPNAQCPGCGSLERHRLSALYLKDKTNLFFSSLRLLHVAPEECLQRVFRTVPNLEYTSIDLESPLAEQKMDIRELSFPDAVFDCIICSHVLEHIPDDQKAMKELLRVLKPGGWALIQSPVDQIREITFEDPTIVTKEDRLRCFGQEDHVRIYGRDYVNRLQNNGWNVIIDEYSKGLSDDDVRRFGLDREETIYFCRKL